MRSLLPCLPMPFSRFCAPSLLLLVAACVAQPKRPAVTPSAPAAGVKIGNPYVVMGKRYFPEDDRHYDARGIASWYGPTFHAKPTANGEIYNQDDVTAAHKTLPMPSWVEVTNLDNGRQLVVRVNDRGPFVDGRIIDLSRRSAQLLGVDRVGLANVRVKRVYPPHDWARNGAPASRHIQMASGTPAVSPLTPPPATRNAAANIPAVATTAVPPSVRSSPASAATAPEGKFIQVAAVNDRGRAEWLARNLRMFGPSAAQPAPNGLWRVRLGPFSLAHAHDILGEIHLAGYPDAVLIRSE